MAKDKNTGSDADQDDFDLDAELEQLGQDDDDDLGLGGSYGRTTDPDKVPKDRVKELVKKRLDRERGRQQALRQQFKDVYGMEPEAVLQYGRAEITNRGAGGQAAGANTGAASGASAQGAGTASAGAASDPIMQKLQELDNRQREFELGREREREAAEFVQKYPSVKFSEIPPEVLQRRQRGGVTLAESYRLFTADKDVQEAARQAAETTSRNYRTGERARTEGADFGGSTRDTAASLNPDERDMANHYGMTPKQYVAYKEKLRREQEA